MNKLFIIAFVAFFGLATANAQDYQTSVGFRGGYGAGVSIKHFLNETNAVEGIAAFRYHGFKATALYEIHKGRVADVEYLNWYFGGGAHVGIADNDWSYYKDWNSHIYAGLDAILGVEYTFTEFDLPFNVSLDFKPGFNIGYRFLSVDEVAFSIRYNFR